MSTIKKVLNIYIIKDFNIFYLIFYVFYINNQFPHPNPQDESGAQLPPFGESLKLKDVADINLFEFCEPHRGHTTASPDRWMLKVNSSKRCPQSLHLNSYIGIFLPLNFFKVYNYCLKSKTTSACRTSSCIIFIVILWGRNPFYIF